MGVISNYDVFFVKSKKNKNEKINFISATNGGCLCCAG